MDFLEQYITRAAGVITTGDIIKPAMEPSAQGQKNLKKVRKRNRRRKILLIGFLAAYALMGWLRLRGALIYQDFFDSINLRPSPVYLAISGGAIGFLFSLAIILLVFKTQIGSRFSRWLADVFLIWFWVDRIWLSTREAFFNRLEISLLVTAATLFWAFVLIRKNDMVSKLTSPTIHNESLPVLNSEIPAFKP